MSQQTKAQAVWKTVSEAIIHDIAQGAVDPGDKLPPSSRLAERFGVHQHTVLKAIAHLQDEGLLRIEQGRGTYVTENAVTFRLGQRTWFEYNLKERNLSPSRRILSVLETPADQNAAALLGIEEGNRVIQVEVLNKANGLPFSFNHHVFSLGLFPDLAVRFERFGTDWRDDISFAEIVGQYGFEGFKRDGVRIRSRMPDQRLARLLSVGVNTPIIQTETTFSDKERQPISYGTAYYPSDRVILSVDF